MGAFDLDKYTPVEERISMFYEGYPLGRIFTTIERLEPPLVVFRAEIYRLADDAKPWATGYAYEKEGEGHVNRTSYIENCETSAIGRALANAGYHGRRDGSPRPSREEMEKVERMGSTPADTKTPGPSTFSLDQVAPGAKAEGKTWTQLLTTENGRGYIVWAVGNMTRLTDDGRKQLLTALLNNAATSQAVDVDQSARIEGVIKDGVQEKMAAAAKWLSEQTAKKAKVGA